MLIIYNGEAKEGEEGPSGRWFVSKRNGNFLHVYQKDYTVAVYVCSLTASAFDTTTSTD